jgi:MYXO-CTERM domain-containing protein
MKLNFKGVALAAVMAASSFAPAKAAALTDLGLDYIGDYIFTSSVSSASSFFGTLQALALTNTYGEISGYFASFLDTGEDIEGISTVTKLGGRKASSWLAEITFNSGTIGFVAADVSGTVTPTTGEVVPVPGPEAGAGIGALAMAGVAYVAMRRRKQLAA